MHIPAVVRATGSKTSMSTSGKARLTWTFGRNSVSAGNDSVAKQVVLTSASTVGSSMRKLPSDRCEKVGLTWHDTCDVVWTSALNSAPLLASLGASRSVAQSAGDSSQDCSEPAAEASSK